MPRRWKVLAAAAMVTCFTSGWFLQRQLAPGGDVYQQARLFETVMAHVRDYHVDSIGEPELYRRAADGLLGPAAGSLRGAPVGEGARAARRAHHRGLRRASACWWTRGTAG